MMPKEEQLDNILVRQKNRIIWLIDNGFHQAARAAMDVVCELWESCGYAYKTHELEHRLTQAIVAEDNVRLERVKKWEEAQEAENKDDIHKKS